METKVVKYDNMAKLKLSKTMTKNLNTIIHKGYMSTSSESIPLKNVNSNLEKTFNTLNTRFNGRLSLIEFTEKCIILHIKEKRKREFKG